MGKKSVPICKECLYMCMTGRAICNGNNNGRPRGDCFCTHPEARESFMRVCPQSPNLIFPVIKCIKIYRLVLWCSPLTALEAVAAQRFWRFLVLKASHSKNFQAQAKNPIFQKFAGYLRDVRDRSDLHQSHKAHPQSWGRASVFEMCISIFSRDMRRQ